MLQLNLREKSFNKLQMSEPAQHRQMIHFVKYIIQLIRL